MPGNINEARIRQNKFKYMYISQLAKGWITGRSPVLQYARRLLPYQVAAGVAGGFLPYLEFATTRIYHEQTPHHHEWRSWSQVAPTGGKQRLRSHSEPPPLPLLPPPANYTRRRCFLGCLLPGWFGLFPKVCKWKGGRRVSRIPLGNAVGFRWEKKKKKEGTRNELT